MPGGGRQRGEVVDGVGAEGLAGGGDRALDDRVVGGVLGRVRPALAVAADPPRRVQPLQAGDPSVVAGYRLGVNSYVVKPVEFTAFVEAVRELGLYWVVLNTAPGSAG